MAEEITNNMIDNQNTVYMWPHKYRSPEICELLVDYTCLIADSLLEDIQEGEEWVWED